MKSMRLFLAFGVLSLAMLSTPNEVPAEKKGAAPPYEIMVPMRDGVRLATNVFKPKGEGPWPTVVIRTPYGKDESQMRLMNGRYTGNGYAIVIQDTRGKFRSEGEYIPFEDDYRDGYDTIEWTAAQEWCDGKVGISGPSALGITSNVAAAANPPHLVAAYVVVAPHSMFEEASFQGGVFKEQDTGGWMRGQGAGDQVPEMRERVVWDERWERTDLPQHLHRVDIPMYNVGGWYDIFAQGNINNFAYLHNEGADGARGNQKLKMGPFGHGNLSGGLNYPRGGGLIQALSDEIRWYDYWLKGEDNGIMDEPAVSYYMMASAQKGKASKKNEWREIDNWPPESETVRMYLHPDKSLSEKVNTGDLGNTSYDFDPTNPVPTVGGANLRLPLGPRDQSEIGDRQDYLRFESSVLEEDLEVAGRISVELYVSTDAPDTDFMAKLVDVYPDGYEALLLDAPIRTRYRDGRRPEDVKLMKPGEPVKLEIDLWSTANIFEKGHKVALHITSSNSPRFEINPNTGAEPNETPMKEIKDEATNLKQLIPQKYQVAKNTIHHSKEYPSALVLPVIKK